MTSPGSRHGFPMAGSVTGSHRVTGQVDFGHPVEDGTASVTVAATWCDSSCRIIASPLAVATADHDVEDAAVEGLRAYVANVVPGVGFDIICEAPGGTWGRYNVYATG